MFLLPHKGCAYLGNEILDKQYTRKRGFLLNGREQIHMGGFDSFEWSDRLRVWGRGEGGAIV